jgi:small-conductance mechanosensitive channel
MASRGEFFIAVDHRKEKRYKSRNAIESEVSVNRIHAQPLVLISMMAVLTTGHAVME